MIKFSCAWCEMIGYHCSIIIWAYRCRFARRVHAHAYEFLKYLPPILQLNEMFFHLAYQPISDFQDLARKIFPLKRNNLSVLKEESISRYTWYTKNLKKQFIPFYKNIKIICFIVYLRHKSLIFFKEPSLLLIRLIPLACRTGQSCGE